MKVWELIAHLQDDIDLDSEVEVEVSGRFMEGIEVLRIEAMQYGISFTGGAGRHTATLICR